ncbi:MAG: hypothetical protein HOC27_04105 [Phycisphaerae bacterium]|nr:hypothetical protein [Phycisphaerae bacterium]
MTAVPFDPHQAMADARGLIRLSTNCKTSIVLANSPGLVRFSIGLTGSLHQRLEQMKEAIAVCS